LAEWKWEEGGVWVGLYGPRPSSEGGVEDSGAAVSKGAGAAGPNAAWILQTAMDKDGKMWTRHGPDVIVAKRIRALAGATCGFMRGIENLHGPFDVKVGFRSSLSSPHSDAMFLTGHVHAPDARLRLHCPPRSFRSTSLCAQCSR
jgi:Nrap protein PAP/OAS1-like domain 5